MDSMVLETCHAVFSCPDRFILGYAVFSCPDRFIFIFCALVRANALSRTNAKHSRIKITSLGTRASIEGLQVKQKDIGPAGTRTQITHIRKKKVASRCLAGVSRSQS